MRTINDLVDKLNEYGEGFAIDRQRRSLTYYNQYIVCFLYRGHRMNQKMYEQPTIYHIEPTFSVIPSYQQKLIINYLHDSNMRDWFIDDIIKIMNKESLCHIFNQFDNVHKWGYNETPSKASKHEIDDFTIYKDDLDIVKWNYYVGYKFSNIKSLTDREAFILLRWIENNSSPFTAESKTIQFLEEGDDIN